MSIDTGKIEVNGVQIVVNTPITSQSDIISLRLRLNLEGDGFTDVEGWS